MRAGIRVLGPLEAEVEGARADLGGPLQRAVLALLLMERGRVVSVDRMIDQLWRGEPPARAIASLQAYVSNLRRILEPGRARRAQARILVSAPPGYAVRLPDEAVDRLAVRVPAHRGPQGRAQPARTGPAGARAGAGAVARPGLRRVRRRGMGDGRGGPADRAASGRAGSLGRGRAQDRGRGRGRSGG